MTIYEPSDDSFLLTEVLKNKIKNKNPNFLEIGIGSGMQLITAKALGLTKIQGVDINPKAVEHCRNLGFDCRVSNLFKNIKGKFDLIIFNPPYLPEDIRENDDSKLATTGGKKGSEIINKFLKQAKKHLEKNGKIFLLTSSLTKEINWKNWKKKKVAEKKLFFEKLYVFELSLS